MQCCEKCFRDAEIVAIIKSHKARGTCDYCAGKNVHVYCYEDDNTIKEFFESFLDLYEVPPEESSLAKDGKTDLLRNILANQWSIFSLPPHDIHRFLQDLLPERYAQSSALFNGPVCLVETDKATQSILGEYEWSDFVSEIKNESRYNTKTINLEKITEIINSIVVPYKRNQIFYRGRIWTTDTAFKPQDMGAPPLGKASAGRANSEGIPCLYLADSLDTTLSEVRAGIHDIVSVGHFKLKRDAKVIDLTLIDKVSPFTDINKAYLAVNRPHFLKIVKEIAKPLRRHDSPLDYLPTQYLCDLIKSLGYDGIKYPSTMKKGGINYAFFDQNFFRCTKVEAHSIDAIDYRYSAAN